MVGSGESRGDSESIQSFGVTMDRFDLTIIGGGIVGIATAMTLKQRHPKLRVCVTEAEGRVAAHQSGHNSGVLHSGIYYKPGSDKAKLCRSGKEMMEAFCDEHQVPWDRCGKVVVATNQSELERLDRIQERARANGVIHERIDEHQLKEIEPASAGIAALYVPETGIVNYRCVCEKMADRFRDLGGVLQLDFQVSKIESVGHSLLLNNPAGTSISSGGLINCAGLYSDRICRLAGGKSDLKVLPFRGEYYELAPGSEALCRNLIYPVPDPSFPFLGVHFTRMVDGGVECGPNAVFALSRTGYRWSDVSPADILEAVAFSGFRRLAAKHWRMGIGEMHRSLSKHAFVRALQHLIPSIRSEHLIPGRSGVRAQAVTPDGKLYDDFLIVPSDRAIHVLNAPSPAATSSLAIASHVADAYEALS